MKQFSSYFFSLAVLLSLTVSTASAQHDKTASSNDNKEFRSLLQKNAAAMGIPKADVSRSIITDAYTDDVTGITYMYVQQAYQGIKVFNVIISSAFKNGALQSASGKYVPALETKINSTTPAKTPVDAVRSAARHLKLNEQAALTTVADRFAAAKTYEISSGGIAKRNIDVTLVWVASEDATSVKLAWNVNIDVANSNDWWNVRIDALTGEYIEKDNWTVNENHGEKLIPILENNSTPLPSVTPQAVNTINLTQKKSLLAPPNVATATYRVVPFPIESPLYGSFSNVVNPWELAGAGNNATTHGWHFDGTTNYTITRGNNVFARLDRNATNTIEPITNWPDTSTTVAPSLNFVHTFDPNVSPGTNENKKAMIDNLFYWNNIIHDVTYQYGFTEAAGNFQADNLGRSATGGNDYVHAEAQDGSGSGNANFSTPPDGNSGRMQMYLWPPQPTLTVTAPAGIAGVYSSYEIPFGADNKIADIGTVTGQVTLYDSAVSNHSGCNAALDPSKLAGKIVIVDILGCGTNYISKVKNAQNAGAIGVLAYYPTLVGIGNAIDRSITIPYLGITTATANAMLAQINSGTPVIVSLTPNGISRDGDVDNGIVVHEFGHGVSNRLTGGPSNASCLQNAEQGGEGWSDYLCLMFTTDWANTPITAGAIKRPMGNYALNLPLSGVGIRRYPYSTDITVNPLTYANLSATPTAPHAIGEIWCSALWDMTWNIIQQTGSINPNLYNASNPGGNSIAFNLVMTGMKMQKCSPGFLDARDAILAADLALYNGAHRCAIWSAFAKRGMGVGAVQGSSASATDQTASFDLPASVKINAPSMQQLLPSSQQVVSHTLTCDCAPLADQVVRDTIPAGFTFVSSVPAGATVSGNVVTFPATSFAAQEVKTFSLTLQTPAAGCPVDLSINDNRDGSTTGNFVSAGTTGFANTTVRAHSPTTSWLSGNAATVAENTLTSGAFGTANFNTLSILSFWHYFNTESTYDGGVIEYSTDGVVWNDAAPLFLSGKYNTAMAAGTVLAGRRAYSGTNIIFTPVMLNVSSLGIVPTQFRFRFTSDDGTGGEGWYVDDIVRMNGCGAILKTGLYNSSNVMTDTIATPIFITSAPLPLRLLSFDAAENNGHVLLNWRTTSEVNVKNFDVEWSVDNTNWSVIGTISAANQPSNRYNSLHADPAPGKNYYRLKIRDIDSRLSSSDTRVVQIQLMGNNQPVLVPNPVKNDATLYISKYNKTTTVKIYDAAGSLVRTLTATPGTQQINISGANLTAGVYVLETTGAERTITKMVVQK